MCIAEPPAGVLYARSMAARESWPEGHGGRPGDSRRFSQRGRNHPRFSVDRTARGEGLAPRRALGGHLGEHDRRRHARRADRRTRRRRRARAGTGRGGTGAGGARRGGSARRSPSARVLSQALRRGQWRGGDGSGAGRRRRREGEPGRARPRLRARSRRPSRRDCRAPPRRRVCGWSTTKSQHWPRCCSRAKCRASR